MASLDEVSRAIGALQAQSSILIQKAEEHDRQTERIRNDLQTLSSDMKVVKDDVASMKPVVRKVQRWEQRAIGVSLLGGIFGGGVLASIRGWFG